jgi:hypothetical protein
MIGLEFSEEWSEITVMLAKDSIILMEKSVYFISSCWLWRVKSLRQRCTKKEMRKRGRDGF